MYCPNCGSNNLAEIKFCTRCGTNLGVVSEALTGRASTQPQVDERMVKLLKDYYGSRRATLIGGITLPAGLALLMALFAIGFPEHLIVLALLGLGLTIYGAIIVIWGIGHWVDSTSEMKALNVVVPEASLKHGRGHKLDAARISPVAALGERYATDPIEPASVTEQTTRALEETASNRSLEGQSE